VPQLGDVDGIEKTNIALSRNENLSQKRKQEKGKDKSLERRNKQSKSKEGEGVPGGQWGCE